MVCCRATMVEMETITKSLIETQGVARGLVEKIKEEVREKAVVVALYGNLGSAKTAFVQGAAKALGISDTIISPTFVIERVYKIVSDNFTHFVHIDAYRLNSGDELKGLGWDELLADPHNIIFVEWAERVEEVLPDNTIKITFEYIDEERRKIVIT